ncbi:MAG TPA: methyltransferase domain-containing protein [Chloroflexota bacterium]|nr:methyltransferase domain-containing protein [Chloroflexota bacterium]
MDHDRSNHAAVLSRHQALVDKRVSDGQIRSSLVEKAFRAVPRHLFLPGVDLDAVYRDPAVTTKRQDGLGISASSQPTIMAILLEQLGLEPGQRVLEIGAGTGYNVALLAEIVGETGQVITVDLDDVLVEAARAHLASVGLHHVRVIYADGGLSYADGGPYDRIILTVGAWDIAPASREQLQPGGRIVLPLAVRSVQLSVAFAEADGHLESVSVRGCGFMLLRGAFAAPTVEIPLGPSPGLSLAVDDPGAVDGAAVYQLLAGSRHDRTTRLAWDAAGRPGTDRLRIRADPVDSPRRPSVNEIVLAKRWTRLGFDWTWTAPHPSRYL